MAGEFRIVPRGKGRILRHGSAMPSPYGLEIIESCITCPHREERLFCDLSPEGVKHLASITSPATYPKGAMLFVEGQQSRGVFVLCTGRVKLSTSSADGKTLILRVAEAGDVLGLAGTLSGKSYELTAEVLEPAQTNFIDRTSFLDFLRVRGEAALRVAQLLSETYHAAIAEMRTIGLSHSAGEKLARFLLDWAADKPEQKGEIRSKLTLTHEEIAQMVGTSRETVTRLFADFKKRKLIEVKGSTLIIRDRSGLERVREA
jgi:CRP/FNR family cyclic AMP-dependent transcriptional regulator